MYSNSFNGDVKRVEIADAGFGSDQHVGVAQPAPRRRAAAAVPVNVIRVEHSAARSASAFSRARSGSASCPPTISPCASGSAGDRLDDEVDALPRIEVAGVADRERRRGTVRIAWTDVSAAGRAPSVDARAVRDDRERCPRDRSAALELRRRARR